MDIEKTIRNYLPQVIHMSLATCAQNKPWVCEVHFVYDNDLNFYFRSTPKRRHSLDIAQNPYVAGTIVTQHFLGQKVRGVYFEGVAEKLEHITEDHIAYQLYCERFDTDQEIITESQREDGHAFYKITVKTFCVYDGYTSNPSTKYELGWK